MAQEDMYLTISDNTFKLTSTYIDDLGFEKGYLLESLHSTWKENLSYEDNWGAFRIINLLDGSLNSCKSGDPYNIWYTLPKVNKDTLINNHYNGYILEDSLLQSPINQITFDCGLLSKLQVGPDSVIVSLRSLKNEFSIKKLRLIIFADKIYQFDLINDSLEINSQIQDLLTLIQDIDFLIIDWIWFDCDPRVTTNYNGFIWRKE